MKRFLLFLLPALIMTACTRDAFLKAMAAPQVLLSYDDFGPESMAASLLGPRAGDTPVIVHHGRTHFTPGQAQVNTLQALNYLRRQHRHAQDGLLRQKLAHTYSRIYPLYRTRRDAFTGGPGGTYGRVGMNRAFILPPMPPSL